MDALRKILREYWGYEEFRPLQAEAMQAALDERDSVVVLPTGGGKSLCFQVPALAMQGLAVVVSPLISLMTDQVDALLECGVPTACINSTLTVAERRRVADQVRAGELRLLYLSPERLTTPRTLEFLSEVPLAFFAIDEAHCISEWGHDFRPEYRALKVLKERFPAVAVHAYTATATPRVRDDIVRELGLADPAVLVGGFDRPNLLYRAQRRGDLRRQIRQVIERHPGESGLIYCMRRADVEELCAALVAEGLRAVPYHAGMPDAERRDNQRAFVEDRAEIVVATVAFGMGIDKPDVRYVIHAAAPKSLEAYQQECGRAGRDGLPAECWLFYSPADFQIWRKLQSNLPADAYEAALATLAGIENYCRGATCRHRALVEYFGEAWPGASCGACDACLDELDEMPDALVLAQKIVSCVVRLGEGYGGDYTAQVLIGSHDERIVSRRHDQLSTHGLLADFDKRQVRDWIEQLVAQGFLNKESEYRRLQLTATGRELLRGDGQPRLLQAAPPRTARAAKGDRRDPASWDGVDRRLFEALRQWRTTEAREREVPPYVIFGDATLRELARLRPTSYEALARVRGIGQHKLAAFGDAIIDLVVNYRRAQDVGTS
ncbi:MAG: DNA helicase RecQ [Pirellulales bacterium]|nr:DNA helicase RecQ [Pirellulales bacterium]